MPSWDVADKQEDLIIPHTYTFYDFIINKARGKSGPLFNFDVHEDVRMVSDATREKDESHAGKVVERAWYNRFKHVRCPPLSCLHCLDDICRGIPYGVT